MSKIQELERQLEEAKKEELAKEAYKKLSEAKKEIGKAFSTHTFQRLPKPNTRCTLLKVIDVYINDSGQVRYTCETLNLNFGDPYTGKRNSINITHNTSMQYEHPRHHWIGNFSHEISSEIFDRILLEFTAHAETYFDKIRGLFHCQEMITQGDFQKSATSSSWIAQSGLKLFSVPKDVYELLTWDNHPFLYTDYKMLATSESLEIVKLIYRKMEQNAISWGGVIYERDTPRVKKLKEFYNEYTSYLD